AGAIEGRDTANNVVFTIAIVGGQLQTTLFEAIRHLDKNEFDASTVLALAGEAAPIQLQYSVTRTDGDGDSISRAAAIDLISTRGSGI
ncbi:DUF5801 repeats-in-toxin domain-containing protein, partial [Bosea sp. Leaf344]|uniref:DUF5801 repeats-in-toxin domain-containing protein n=1 Tax=Bosea sp. Leaf344 TaxID=1736346 RepID=UPI00138EEB68